jgi:pyruvate dehydrogenase E2 component (dihydrolipoamide acetyltransferase)
MPKLGLTMTEAKITQWYKKEGEAVTKGELLFTLETEKATLEIEAPASGVLHILAPLGETVPVNAPIAVLVVGEADTVTGKQGDKSVPSPLSPLPSPLSATPKARALARKQGVSLQRLAGSGIRGMIVAADLEKIAPPKATPLARKLAAEAGLELGALAGSGPCGKITRQDVLQTLEVSKTARVSPARPLAGLRAVIAERMSAGWRERPQVTLTTEADATNLVSARQQLNAELDDKISYNAFLVMIAARALREHPHVNIRLTQAGIEALPHINIGVAVDTERGLLVPVIHDAPAKSLIELDRLLRELAERAIAGRSLPDELTGGTFTITNLGMYDIDAFTPIINPPECAILGVGRIVARPVGLNGQIILREMMALSLSFDHRLIDGAPAARFLQRIKQLIERPFALLAGEKL